MNNHQTAKRYKYEKIVEHYSSAIASGSIVSGTKLPSLRKTATQFNCALSVALQAYQELEVTNIIRGVEKSGYFALPVTTTSQPTPEKGKHRLTPISAKPNSFTGRIVEIGTNPNILPLGCAVPAQSILPLAKLKKSIISLTKSKPELLCEYSPASGNLFLRQEIAKLMLQRGMPCSPNEVTITNGCTEALVIAVKSATEIGDIVAVESPAYFGLLTILKQLGRKVLEIPSAPEGGLELSIFSEVLKKNKVAACIFTANFQNPLGSVMSEKSKESLITIAEKNDITLIEDDIYGECAFDNKSRSPAKRLDVKGNLIYCSSFSKSVSPGLRIGWIIGGKYHDRCVEEKLTGTLGNPNLLQQALATFLCEGGYNYHIRKFRKQIAQQTFKTKELLLEHFPDSCKISHPQGGFFLWVELPEKTSALELFKQALAKNIGIVPGPVFSSNAKMFSNSIRISCGFPVTDKTENGIATLSSLINKVNKI